MLKRVELLRREETCWRIERAERVATLIDSESYFANAMAAMRKARHSILLVGWSFDPRTPLDHRGDPGQPACVGDLLTRLADERPDLDARVLIWNMAWPLAYTHGFYPQRSHFWFRGGRVKFRLDGATPSGASQHQKILVVDDAVAFCGGGDLALNRWDTVCHEDDDPLRVTPQGKPYPPRHEVMMMAQGPVAAALGEIARERWRRATGETLSPPPPREAAEVWPDNVACDFSDLPVAIARTEPKWNGQPEVREIEALHVASIAAARRSIYLENQYFSSIAVAEALAARLAEPDGPEVTVVTCARSPGLTDGLVMDAARDRVVELLRARDRHGRLRLYAPFTRAGRPIVVHSKVAIVDDRFLRVGSANLNNRSMGFDTECDLAIDADRLADGDRVRRAIAAFRDRLIGHYLGAPEGRVARTARTAGGPQRAIEALDRGQLRRLRPLEGRPLGPLRSLIARYHVGDPEAASETWRPWRRRSAERALASTRRKSTTKGK